MKKLLAVMVTVLAFACGGERSKPIDDGSGGPGPVVLGPGPGEAGGDDSGGGGGGNPGDPLIPPVETGGLEQAIAAELRLSGRNPGDYDSVLAQVRSVEVVVDGRSVPFALRRGYVELNAGEHAWLVGRFELPRGAKQVHVELAFDDFGGYQSKSGAGEIDFRAPPIEFSAPAEYFIRNQHAVVHYDLSRSLVAWRGHKLALPNIEVQY